MSVEEKTHEQVVESEQARIDVDVVEGEEAEASGEETGGRVVHG